MSDEYLTIEVKQAHIDDAIRRRNRSLESLAIVYSLARECPIGLACGGFSGPHRVTVDGSFAAYDHSAASLAFMDAFDNGRPVAPSTFRLRRFVR